MARYRKIHVVMYADDKFNALSAPQPNAQTLWIYLLTGPHTTAIPGLSCAGEKALAESLGWPIVAWRKCFKEISTQEMAVADWDRRVLWLPKAINYNPPESANVIKGWRKAWEEIPPSDLKVTALQSIRQFLTSFKAVKTGKRADGFLEAFRKAFPEAYALESSEVHQKTKRENVTSASPYQEQEQEQDIPILNTESANGKHSAGDMVPEPPAEDDGPSEPAKAKFPDGVWRKACDGWMKAYEHVHGVKYLTKGKQDWKCLGQILEALDADLEAFKKVVFAWFKEQQIGQVKGHTLPALWNDLNFVREKIAKGTNSGTANRKQPVQAGSAEGLPL